MNEQEAIEWMVEEGLADNDFSAKHIYEPTGLNLEGLETEHQKKLVEVYRKWRGISKNTKLCYAYTLAGVAFPKMYEKETKDDTIESLGFHQYMEKKSG